MLEPVFPQRVFKRSQKPRSGLSLARLDCSSLNRHLGRPGRGFRPRPFGPGRSLGFLRISCDLLRFPNQIPTETLLLRWIPGPGSREANFPISLRGPRTRRPGPAGRSLESGFGFRLALLPHITRSSAGASRSLRTVPLIRWRSRFPRLLPFPASFRWGPPPSWDCNPEQSDSGKRTMLNRHPHLHLWLWIVTRGSHPPWHPVPRDLNPEGNTNNVRLRDYNSEQHSAVQI
jgi:hypothetical protein